jgi:glycosyltransferase involved in cell wall biosynthesis
MGDPLVSTIIPTYNRARELCLAVESALGQTYPRDRHEIIVVDDGSDDGGATREALRPYRRHVRFLRKRNGGVSCARNFGLANARGELYAFLDSDDEWLPEKLRRQVDFLAEHPHCGVVLTDFVRIDHERCEVGRVCLGPRFADPGPNLAQALRYPGLPPSTVLARREVIQEVGAFNTGLRTAEDIEFHLRVAHRFAIGLVPEPLVRYKMGHADGLSHGRRTYRDLMTVIQGCVDRHRDELEPEVARRLLFLNRVANARGLILGGWYRDGLALALRAARLARRPGEAAALGRLGVALARNALSRSVKRVALVHQEA